jgi:predicted small integral membrane protein
MNGHAAPRGPRIMAWLVVLVCAVLIVLGLSWYGFSLEVHNRMWRDMAERTGGPMSFRFFLQPAMAAIAAFHDGLKDARAHRTPFLRGVLREPAERGDRLRESLLATARILLLGIGMDAVYQWRVMDAFYPGEALLVALLLAFVPYLLLRGPVDLIARRFLNQAPR